MDVLAQAAVIVLALALVGAAVLFILAVYGQLAKSGSAPEVTYGDELAKWLKLVGDRHGRIHTRVTTSSASMFTPVFERFLHGIVRGDLSPLKHQTELQLYLWRSIETTVIISQNGLSICVFKLNPDDDADSISWAELITNSLKAVK